MKKKLRLIIWAIVALAAIILVVLGVREMAKINSDENIQPIGGQRDSHGCLGPAGYSWNQSEQRCVREWETNASLRYQD